jgi:2-polyprenyl-3-methyl-5-hydroxy-6-metoxy-1,4-benzoquinol methylase
MQTDMAYSTLACTGRWCSKGAFERYHQALFAGVKFRDRRVLDVGGGIGSCSFWAALGGALEVVCLEPEDAGATTGTCKQFDVLAHELALTNVRRKTVILQDFDASAETFDIIVMNSSINHLDEDACIALRTSDNARQRYRTIFNRVANLARPQADLIISDCTPNNLFPRLGLRHPISTSIEWHKHQPPETWAKELAAVGFEQPDIRWTSYARLGQIGWQLTANRWAAFVLKGHFILKMKRRQRNFGWQDKIAG